MTNSSAFDLEYEYDVREAFDKYLQGKIALSHYLDMLNFQEAMYPANYNKLRFLENHDQPRICSFVHDEQALVNYTAYLYFLKGTTLLYGGQEFENTHTPSLFEKGAVRAGDRARPQCAAAPSGRGEAAVWLPGLVPRVGRR